MYKVFRKLLSEKDVNYIFETFNRSTGAKWGRLSAVNSKSHLVDSYDSRRATAQTLRPEQIDQDLKDKIMAVVQEVDSSRKFFFLEHWSINRYDDSERGHFYWHKDRLEGFMYHGSAIGKRTAEDIFIHNMRPPREMSISVALNDRTSYNGGQFTIDVGDGKQTPIDLDTGDIVVFDSDTLHGVDDVTKGTRYSLVIWLVEEERYLQWKQLCLEQGTEIT
jgi:predicted 2-oxoglutarate/Fe(II)-dependent dioxygenase YbiX